MHDYKQKQPVYLVKVAQQQPVYHNQVPLPSHIQNNSQHGSLLIQNQYLKNKGAFEWLSYDNTRQNAEKWEGRAQLQYPDVHIANRYAFNNVEIRRKKCAHVLIFTLMYTRVNV